MPLGSGAAHPRGRPSAGPTQTIVAPSTTTTPSSRMPRGVTSRPRRTRGVSVLTPQSFPMAAPLPARPTSGPAGACARPVHHRAPPAPTAPSAAATSQDQPAMPSRPHHAQSATDRTAPTSANTRTWTHSRRTPASRCAVSSPAGNPTSPTGTIATSSAYGRYARATIRPEPVRSCPTAAAAIPSPTTLTPASTTRHRRHSAAIAPGPRTSGALTTRPELPDAGHPARAPREHPQVEPLADHGERARQPDPPAVRHREGGHDEPQVPRVVALDGERLLATEQVTRQGAVAEADAVRAALDPDHLARHGQVHRPEPGTTHDPQAGDGLRTVREHLDERGLVHLPAQQRVADRREVERRRARHQQVPHPQVPVAVGERTRLRGADLRVRQPGRLGGARAGAAARAACTGRSRARSRRRASRPSTTGSGAPGPSPRRPPTRARAASRRRSSPRRPAGAARAARDPTSPTVAAAAHQSPIVRTTAPTSSAASETK